MRSSSFTSQSNTRFYLVIFDFGYKYSRKKKDARKPFREVRKGPQMREALPRSAQGSAGCGSPSAKCARVRRCVEALPRSPQGSADVWKPFREVRKGPQMCGSPSAKCARVRRRVEALPRSPQGSADVWKPFRDVRRCVEALPRSAQGSADV